MYMYNVHLLYTSAHICSVMPDALIINFIYTDIVHVFMYKILHRWSSTHAEQVFIHLRLAFLCMPLLTLKMFMLKCFVFIVHLLLLASPIDFINM